MEFSNVLYSIKHIFFIFIVLWGIFSIFHLFHNGLAISWRITIVIIFFIFVFFYFSILFDLYKLIYHNPMLYLKNFLQEFLLIIKHLDIVIYFLWPNILIFSFFSVKEKKSLEFIKFLIVFTLLYWIYLSVKDNKKILEIWHHFVLQEIQK